MFRFLNELTSGINRAMFLSAPCLLLFPIAAHAGTTSAKAVVFIESYQYTPARLKVKKGASVEFVNNDGAPHTVSPANKDDFAGTGRLLKGERKSVIFDKAGEIKYYCDFHPSMEGTVLVSDK